VEALVCRSRRCLAGNSAPYPQQLTWHQPYSGSTTRARMPHALPQLTLSSSYKLNSINSTTLSKHEITITPASALLRVPQAAERPASCWCASWLHRTLRCLGLLLLLLCVPAQPFQRPLRGPGQHQHHQQNHSGG
jgi:hypothetical protein